MDQRDVAYRLYQAIVSNRVIDVQELLNIGCSADVILETKAHLTPLIFATVQKNIGIVKLLIKFKASLNMKDEQGKTAIMYACGHKPILSELIKGGADLEAVDNGRKTAFLYAAQTGSVECLQLLMDRPGVDLDQADCDGRSAVMLAARRKDLECLKLLLKYGADVNKADHSGDSPLLVTIHRYKCDNALFLLNYSQVKVNVCNNEGKTPLTKACEQLGKSPMKPVITKLLECGARPSFSTRDEGFLHELILRGEHDIVQRMIANGCAPRLRLCKESIFKIVIPEEISPLAVALLYNQTAIARYFLAISFLTLYDVNRLHKDASGIRKHLIKNNLFQCKSLLENFGARPLPLLTLSLTSLSSLYFNSNSAWRIFIAGNLPGMLRRKLLFQTEWTSLCFHEWEAISLRIEPGQETGHRRQRGLTWPVRDELTPCEFSACRQRNGYRIVKNFD